MKIDHTLIHGLLGKLRYLETETYKVWLAASLRIEMRAADI